MSRPRIILRPAPAAARGLPSYVEHGGEPVCRHPADALNIRLYGFAVEADRDRLDDWCDRCFNEPSGGAEQFRSASRFLLLNFVDIPTMGSTDPLDYRLGVTPEHEVALWLPVLDVRRRRLAWAIPYMFVDSGMALLGGRETYGFPKQLGTPSIPRTGSAPDVLSLNAVTLQRFEPTSQVADLRVVTAQRAGPTVQLEEAWTDAAEAVRALLALALESDPRRPSPAVQSMVNSAVSEFMSDPFQFLDDVIGDVGTAVLLAQHLLDRNVPMILLKQFRDAALVASACYQGIIEVANTVTTFRRGGFLPVYEVRFEELAGQPIHRELGVPRDPQSPRAAIWLEFDFLVHLGAVLWEADARRI